MKPISCLLAVILAGATLAQDDNSRRDAVVKSMIAFMDKLTRVLKTVQDEETSKAARPELKKCAEEWSALLKSAKNTPPPLTKEEQQRLAREYKTKIEDAQKKLYAEIGRVQFVPGGRDAMTEITKALAAKKDPEP